MKEIDNFTALQVGMATLYEIATGEPDTNAPYHIADRIQAAEALSRLALDWVSDLVLSSQLWTFPVEDEAHD